MRRTPLRPQRREPRRRAPERVQHKRTKPKAGAAPTTEEKRHMGVVAAMGCLICSQKATVHHVTGYADRIGRAPRSHQCVVPLCPTHHQIQHGPRESVEALGHQGFFLTYGIDLRAEGDRLWIETAPLRNRD